MTDAIRVMSDRVTNAGGSIMTGKALLFLFVLSAVGLAARTSEATQGNLTIYQNTVLQEDHYGTITFGGDNIFLDCNDKKIIFDATVPTSYNCTTVFPMTCGIVAKGRYNAQIDKCHVEGKFGAGIYLWETKWALVSNSFVTGAPGDGLIAVYGDHLRLQNIRSTYNSGRGFFIMQIADYVKAAQLVAAYNGRQGIHVSYTNSIPQSLNLTASTSTSNGGDGVFLSKTLGGIVDGNTIIQNGGIGLNVSSSAPFKFSNNYSSGNQAGSPTGCDAAQTGLTNNTWTGNFFSYTCPTVPSPH